MRFHYIPPNLRQYLDKHFDNKRLHPTYLYNQDEKFETKIHEEQSLTTSGSCF